MALLVNGTRPDKIIVNGEEKNYLYVNVGDYESFECIWSKRFPAQKVHQTGGTFTVERIAHENIEDNTQYLSDGIQNVYVYAGDTLKITTIPAINYELDTIQVQLVGTKTLTSVVSPFEFIIGTNYAKTTTNVIITASFKEKQKIWHTIWSGSYQMSTSSSTSSYTTDIYCPSGYQSITDPTLIRVTGKLYRKATTSSSLTIIKELSAVTGNQTITDSISSSAIQYLNLLPNGIQSKVKSVKSGLKTYTYYWAITKIEQYY